MFCTRFYLVFYSLWRISPCGCLNSLLWNALHTCTVQSHIASQINFIANLLCNKMLHYVGLWLIACSCDKRESCEKKKLVCEQCASDYNRLRTDWLLYALVKWRFSVVECGNIMCFLLQKSCPSAYLCPTARSRRMWWAGLFFFFSSLRCCCTISQHSLHLHAFMCY